MAQNRLAQETSPYLLQHKDNPVGWWPWGAEAFAEAKAKGKPVLLSVGYAACHWCHVMAHESFEDSSTAALMNELYVNIKVDREERPDVDALYMAALLTLGESGGWPMTMFLTPGGEPFYGGTYFPNVERFGRPSFKRVLSEIARIYREEPSRVGQNASAIRDHLESSHSVGRAGAASTTPIADATLQDVVASFVRAFDAERGGLRGAPKFPQFSLLWFLWRASITYGLSGPRSAVLTTLRNVCQGGIYDHIGGGFARYSVDELWLVPHFEKMLYDNALLVLLLVEAWKETKDRLFAERIGESIEWLLREMQTPEGGFASSFDADSGGEEGKFYVWAPAEVAEVLGAVDAEWFCNLYDITEQGNFEGHSIPNRLAKLDLEDETTEARLSLLKQRLLAARRLREPPGWDDKVLADWNGLAIAALAEAGRAFGRAEWITGADRALDFISDRMMPGGRLRHSFRAGALRGPATAADYADLIWGALALYQATNEPNRLDLAAKLEKALREHYWVPERGGYAQSADDTSDLVLRLEIAHDDATPNANAVMIENLSILHALTAEETFLRRAEETQQSFSSDIAANLAGHTGMIAASVGLARPMEVVVVTPTGSESTSLAETINSLSLPGALRLVVRDTTQFGAESPIHGKGAIGGKPTAYVCVGGTCSLPVTEPNKLLALLKSARTAPTVA
jgi:uncharacterized protein YyaL (SSP411 family)